MTAVAVPADPAAGRPSLLEVSRSWPSMGGRVSVRLATSPELLVPAVRAMAGMEARLDRWVARLTRFNPASELSTLNQRAGEPLTRVGPTLGGVLDWAERAHSLTDGVVDITLLEQRLAAESGDGLPAAGERSASRPAWWLERRPRRALVHRRGTVRFDLDGVAKGWLADRALALLRAFPAALVDADGDIAARPIAGLGWLAGVADPRDPEAEDLAVLRLEPPAADQAGAGAPPDGALGLATSGTSVHRWRHPRVATHHLIDPVTGRPAATDVVQATVLAGSAREAEALAKTMVIVGSERALDLAERRSLPAAVLLLESGEVLASAGIGAHLA